ncbi:putative oxidoreductase [Colletotrichum trifolii]|uniref:Putative oxidoreductase n=1 Tax=Colletotrichum trifolii TaxID=5466 RepID=A0A4R8RMW1_COLTR|nr:putative oxidoreductase [Colletotrichum trifolii]
MPSFNPDRDIPDLSGKVILVTGGNNGLDKQTVLQLSKHNPAHIFMGARSEKKALEAVTEIRNAVPNAANITFLKLDLASFESVKEAASSFLAQPSQARARSCQGTRSWRRSCGSGPKESLRGIYEAILTPASDVDWVTYFILGSSSRCRHVFVLGFVYDELHFGSDNFRAQVDTHLYPLGCSSWATWYNFSNTRSNEDQSPLGNNFPVTAPHGGIFNTHGTSHSVTCYKYSSKFESKLSGVMSASRPKKTAVGGFRERIGFSWSTGTGRSARYLVAR